MMTWLTLQQMRMTLTFSQVRYRRQFTSARLRPFGLASLGLSRGSKPMMKASHKTLSFLCAYASFAYAQGHKLLNDFKPLKSKSQKLKPLRVKALKTKRFAALSYKSIKARASNPRHLSSFGYRGFFLDPLRVNLSSASLRSETKTLKMKGLKA